jgi:hypothetical protein
MVRSPMQVVGYLISMVIAVENLVAGLSVNQTARSKSKVPRSESRKGGDVASKVSSGEMLFVVITGFNEKKVGEDTGFPLPIYLTFSTEDSS